MTDEEIEKLVTEIERGMPYKGQFAMNVRRLCAAAREMQAENKRLSEGMIFANKWGIQLIDALGKFLATAAASSGPVSSKILCQFPDAPETPVLHLWASTDGQSPIARNAELRDQIRERDYQIVQLQTSAAATAAKEK